ncbi:MAG: M23 family metallopeptidase [Holosporales bacterium]|jgi:lipoprotein NlpD|nr:M23 family metallopeptidase [Holosporales bacterium]
MMISFRNLLLFMSTIVGLTSCSGDRNYNPEIEQVERVIPYHVVDEGDTVGTVATKYGMSRSDLIKLNKLQPPYQLYDGQRLIIILRPEGSTDRASESVEADLQKPELPKQEQEEDVKELSLGDNKEVDTNIQIEPSFVGPVNEYVWPITDGRSKISQPFDEGGITIEASAGTPVRAIADGVVKIAGVPEGDAAAYGVTVVLKHDSKHILSIYANLKEATVSKLKKVKKGDIIGKVGKSGTIASKPQLYFELNDISDKGRKPLDPEKVLP